MILNQILLQVEALATDTLAANKIQAATNKVSAQVDSLAQKLSPDSIANFSPSRIAESLKYLDLGSLVTSLSSQVISLAFRILAAIAVFYLGKFIINKIYSVARAIMIRKDFDRSLATFLLSFIKITLLFLLIITVIGILGIETSSFIAIFASAGVAIGMALSGTLQNFAGGVLILLIKPYKVGDYIEFGEHKGFVKEIQIFNTIITTYNNDRIVIPNGGISTGTINNFSTEPYHRLEWRIGISYGDDVDTARRIALSILQADSRILHNNAEAIEEEVSQEATTEAATDTVSESNQSWWRRWLHLSHKRAIEWKETQMNEIAKRTPKKDYTPYVAVESLDDSAVTLIIRAWAKTSDYWKIRYHINEEIYKQFPRNDIHFPFPQMDVHVNHNN